MGRPRRSPDTAACDDHPCMRVTFSVAAVALCACGDAHPRAVIQNKGSDTMVNLAQAWAEAFEAAQSEVSVAVSGGGSGTGIAALIEGTADIANSSRALDDDEARDAERLRGAAPVASVVALDAISVFVHPDNPLAGLEFAELACIYGADGDCEHWSDVRDTVVPGCPGNRIVRVSRQSNSGTAQYFRETVIGERRDLRLGSLDLNGSSEAVRLVEHTPCAIAYVGLGYLIAGVKPLCVATDDAAPCVYPSAESAASRSYPIARELFMVTIGPPEGPAKRFLEWARTPEAIAVLEHTGYVAVHDEEQH
ncbi:MAG: phosphate ABC transporter substrate-binding protein [Deltaproteobacteria bacterium]|nr:phosphate ABC transporter substrate-binding protein [Nannocystaceae bacterium]